MRKITAAGLVAGGLLVGAVAGPTAASAANGGSWLLGRSNSETATTTVTNSAGTPLKLNAKSGYAPLAVNSAVKVPNLNVDKIDGLDSTSFLRSTGTATNADKVDGLHASSFALRSGKTGNVLDDDLSDPWGPECPAGTLATGGGTSTAVYDATYSGPDFYYDELDNAVSIPNSWVALDSEGSVLPSFVTCYNPAGAVAGAATSMPDPLIDPFEAMSESAPGSSSAPQRPNATLKHGATK